jgi:AcrR family transcriptional regulator
MSTITRRGREKEIMIEMILAAAVDIATKEGFDQVSIRKIAGKIDYSPSIIYHYFKDKDEILNQVMEKGYKKILMAISSSKVTSITPEDKLKESTRNYIEAALNMPDEFFSVQTSRSEQTLKFTSSLFEGASRQKGALMILFQTIKEINEQSELDESTIELMAQTIVIATFGLIIKLIIEKDIDEKQKKRLIDHFLNNVLIKLASV